jgi:hypothetical protein
MHNHTLTPRHVPQTSQLSLCLGALCAHINAIGLNSNAALEEVHHPLATRYAALSALSAMNGCAHATPTMLQCHHCAVAVGLLGMQMRACTCIWPSCE